MSISEACKSPFPLTLRDITMQSLTSVVSCHGICQSISITFCLSENNTFASFCMFLIIHFKDKNTRKGLDKCNSSISLAFATAINRRKNKKKLIPKEQGKNEKLFSTWIQKEVLKYTVISGPIIDAFPYMSDATEYKEIPSASFWSESPTYTTQ